MQTTPLETYEIYRYLRDQQRLNPDLRQRLSDTIHRYRLDIPPPGDGRRSFMRRTYTCPFFMDGILGCSLPPQVKPYGCLGFNATKPGVTEGGACESDQELLAQREAAFADSEDRVNRKLQVHYELDWHKRPLPWALLSLWQAIETQGEVTL